MILEAVIGAQGLKSCARFPKAPKRVTTLGLRDNDFSTVSKDFRPRG